MNDEVKWTLGQTSARHESAGKPDTVSNPRGDYGGVSYGTYQLSTNQGAAAEYVAWSQYGAKFKGLEPGTPAFGERWKEVARTEPGFGTDQHDYIKSKYYDVQVESLKASGLDLSSRGPAVQDAIWSTSVQYRGKTPRKFKEGLAEAYGPDFDLASLSDVQIVTALQDNKLRHLDTDFASSPQNIRDGVQSRIVAEKRELVSFAETGIPGDSQARSSALRVGSRGDDVEGLQKRLSELGYMSHDGRPLKADGHFGPSTQEAVRSFQRASGLGDDGVVGRSTLMALEEQVHARAGRVGGEPPSAGHTLKLDDPAHPDHAFFQQTRGLLVDLDRSHGRQSDQRTDNLASYLVVSARQDGLSRVDQVALSDDASRVWAVERPKGIRDNFFDKTTSVPTVEALNTTMARSAELWPAANQTFNAQKQAEVLVRDQFQSQNSTQAQDQTQAVPSMQPMR